MKLKTKIELNPEWSLLWDESLNYDYQERMFINYTKHYTFIQTSRIKLKLLFINSEKVQIRAVVNMYYLRQLSHSNFSFRKSFNSHCG